MLALRSFVWRWHSAPNLHPWTLGQSSQLCGESMAFPEKLQRWWITSDLHKTLLVPSRCSLNIWDPNGHMDGLTDAFCPTTFWNNKLSFAYPLPPPASHLSHVFMLWEKWCNMGKGKQGIWFTRYAYGHSIWQTQGIWPSCSLGRAGKPGASRLFMGSESFSLSMLPSANLLQILRSEECLQTPSKDPSSPLSLLRWMERKHTVYYIGLNIA